MLEELKSDKIINKLGGKFKLTALVQKRLAELLQGSRPLIENTSGMTMMEIVLQEILQDKITMEGASPGSKTAVESTEHTGFQNPSAFDDGDME
jgi:DNA-directed RNA polymerase subunit omega